MKYPPRPRPFAEIVSRWVPLLLFFLGVSASGAIAILPSAPSGFSTPMIGTEGFALSPTTNVLASDAGSSVLRGFKFTTSLGGTYDSNVTQSPGGSVAPVNDDFILSLGGTVSYLSKASAVTFGGSYHGTYNDYFSQSNFSGYSQGGSGVVNYTGGRFTASLTSGINYDQGSNRNYASAFVQQTNVSTALTASYALSRKTTLQGNISQAYLTVTGGNFGNTESFAAGVSALWKYSPLTEFGPGIRYTYLTGSSQTGRSSIGPTVNLNYKLSSKMSLNSRVGVDFATYQDGGSADPALSASIGLNYEASRLWGMNLSLFRDTQADPSVAGSFTQVTALRVGYHRKVRRAVLNLGTGFDTNRSQTPTGGVGGANRDYFTMDASLGMAIFSNTTSASVFTRYSDQSGAPATSWDGFQTGFSLSRSF